MSLHIILLYVLAITTALSGAVALYGAMSERVILTAGWRVAGAVAGTCGIFSGSLLAFLLTARP